MTATEKENQHDLLYIFLIGLLSLLIRLWGLGEQGLNYDETQSVTHAILPLPDLLKSVLTFDPHPPIYYVQLHWWMQLGVSDWWIKSNSVVWSFLTTILLFNISKRMFNLEIAIIASILFAISPFAVLQAQDARMYSLLMFLALLSFMFTRRFLEGPRVLWSGIGVFLTTIAFLYSHGTGFMLLISLFSYTLIHFRQQKNRNRMRFLQWCLLQLLILTSYTLWLARAYSIHLGHLVVPEFSDIAIAVYVLLFGFTTEVDILWFQWGILFITIIALSIATPFLNKTDKMIVISFVIIPIVFCITVSYLYRPIWHYRVLAYITPFLSLAMALVIANIRSHHKKGVAITSYGISAIIISGFLVALIYQQTRASYPWSNIKQAAAYVQSEIEAGDVVYVPEERVFWGWIWYFSGPGGVNPLDSTYSFTTDEGVQIFSKPAIDVTEVKETQAYWLIYYYGFDSTLLFESYQPDMTRDFNGLVVDYFEPKP